MCTASWSADGERLSFCFNRDELKSRGEAIPPEVLTSQGVSLMAATDADAGGTWLAVNEFGLCTFLLNNYAATAKSSLAPEGARSRGELPLRFASCKTKKGAVEAVLESDFSKYRPFVLGLVTVDGAKLLSWDGIGLEELDSTSSFVTSSSYRTAEVEGYRSNRYRELLGAFEFLDSLPRREFHLELENRDVAFNPMMLRNDSRTHSLSTVEVEADQVSLKYEAVLGDSRSLAEPVVLRLPRRKFVDED